MKVAVDWLAEYVELESRKPEDVLAALVRVGLEEESVIPAEVTGPLVVGRILSAEPEEHSNGKTIRWCRVRVAREGEKAADGGEDVRGIVCGAPNAEEGALVVVALPGTVLPGGFAIAARKTYGHVSDGMIASERELGLGTAHEGILRLDLGQAGPAAAAAQPGDDARTLLGLGVEGFEVNVTPDRGYAFSVRGVAREYGHATGRAFTDPASLVQPGAFSGYALAVADDAPVRGRHGVRRFVARVVSDVDPSRPTPAWMAARLRVAGMRSVSLVVDITNYVMLELGNPTHAYDAERLTGRIGTRRARAGERLTTLDGQERTLDPEDLLIVDESGPIGLAGVMGGASTEVGPGTTRVLVEAACFEPVTVARTARRHKLPSEASRRFERGVDPMLAPVAAQRVVDLLVELAGGIETELGGEWGEPEPAAPIALQRGFVQRLVGADCAEEEVVSALRAVGCTVAQTAEGDYSVVPPSWRPDLDDPTGLVEEVARLRGYDRIPSVIPVAPPGRGLTREQRARRKVADALAAAGATEVLSYPFLADGVNALFEPAGRPEVVLENALDARQSIMRRHLLPGLLDVAHRNVSRGLTDLAIFELGRTFRPREGRAMGTDGVPAGTARPDADTLAMLEASVPEQPYHLAAVVTGAAVAKQPGLAARRADWNDAVAVARQAAAALGVPLQLRQGRREGFHPGRTAELVVRAAEGDRTVGHAGELHPEVAAAFDLPGRVAAVELDLGALLAAAPEVRTARPLGTLPAATQDLSLIVSLTVPAAQVRAAVAEGAGPLLENIALVDDYRGAGVPEGSRSLTFSLRFRAPDRTLTAAEASEAKLAGAALAAERLGATVRAQ